MALGAQQQVRQFYVGLDYPGHADVAALQGGTSGDVACLSADGTAAAAGEDFVLLKKTAKGDITTDVIKAENVLSAKSVQHVAKTASVGTVAPGATIAVGDLYTVEIAIIGYGSLSNEDEYIKKAFYKTVTGDDAEAVVDGLIVSLNRNFSRETGATASDNPYFTFAKTGSGASAALTITEKLTWATDNFVPGKKTRQGIDFVVNAKASNLPTITNVGGANGTGTGLQVADLEWYLKGERNDFYREMGYPHNLENTYDAVASSSYNLIELSYFEEGRDEAKKSKKQITIAMPFTNLAGNATINLLIADLNTILGAGTIDALPTS